MWIVAKIKTDQSSVFKHQLNLKFDGQVEYYEPKIFCKRKKLENEKNILGNYIFCFHEKFKENGNLISTRYVKGLNHFLNGCKNYQKEIINFINFCKKNENHYGYLTQNFFEEINLKKAKFVNGPLANLLFEIVSSKKNYLNIIVGNRKIKIKKNFNLVYLPA